MNFTVFLFVFLSCGFILAQDDGGTTKIEENGKTRSHFPNVDDLQGNFDHVMEKVRAAEARQLEIRNQIFEIRHKGRTKVIFTASLRGDGPIGPTDAQKTLIYKTVITNIGNAYSPSTGVFAAPVTGVYYFTISYHAAGEDQARLLLYKNSQLIAATSDQLSQADTADNGRKAVFLPLWQGDQVCVRLDENGNGKNVSGNNYKTTFSGFLITQM